MAKEMMNRGDGVGARRLAIWLANIYRGSAENCMPEMLATLFLLIDFSTFFQHYNEGRSVFSFSVVQFASVLSQLFCEGFSRSWKIVDYWLLKKSLFLFLFLLFGFDSEIKHLDFGLQKSAVLF